ncbi:DUF5590 domain-containing protein [Mangrovibacillus cuniculi]|uniref:DUF5590 domain-containing protein n=1 Tax=Mangrovibacillus cuniculi TaxID=2593652 RepID=A0A7S8HFM1_9BACI|nr:DUF5590 domain-containing protein [Mangrovibacillus cuniculi]QPC46671.1 DUF5590 domain-containing protein [Mangrovibacillus cuniculi]
MVKWIITSLVAILFVLTIGGAWLYVDATKEKNQQEETIKQIALEENWLSSVTNAHTYYGAKPYYVLAGKNTQSQEVYVFVPQDDYENKTEVRVSQGVSKEEAMEMLQREKSPAKLLHTKLGIEKVGPVWEMAYLNDREKLNYYYVHFETGEWWRNIENL